MVLATVLDCGLASVQDGGRHGHTAVGVPTSGALHRERYLVATALLRGSPDDRLPAIELLSGTVAMETSAAVVLAVVGAARLTIDGTRAANGTVLRAPAGACVRIEHVGPGAAYLVLDGWQPPATLGSVATDTLSRIGGGVLRTGHRLEGRPTGSDDRVGAFHRPLATASGPIRVVAVGRRDLGAMAAGSWRVSAVGRSGARLVGGPIAAPPTVPSMPLVPGAIQATPAGELLILGPDGGLTGGYPVVGVVATVDLDRIGMLVPGDDVGLRSVTVADAQQAHDGRRTAAWRSVAHPADLGSP